MKTAIIFNDFEKLRYFIVDGDRKHLDGIYINVDTAKPRLEEELIQLVYGTDGEFILDDVPLVVFADAIRGGAFLIEAGFVP